MVRVDFSVVIHRILARWLLCLDSGTPYASQKKMHRSFQQFFFEIEWSRVERKKVQYNTRVILGHQGCLRGCLQACNGFPSFLIPQCLLHLPFSCTVAKCIKTWIAAIQECGFVSGLALVVACYFSPYPWDMFPLHTLQEEKKASILTGRCNISSVYEINYDIKWLSKADQ